MVELKDQEMGEGMQCITHPYTKNQGGICALCLQEKLGKLVTSSFPMSKPTSQLSSSPPSFSSSSTSSLALSLSSGTNVRDSTNNNLPFLLAKKKKDMLAASSSSSSSSTSSSSSANLMYKRSKSTAAAYGESFRQRKRSGFWSFLHLYSSKHQITSTTKKVENFSHSSRSRNQITETSKRVVGRGIDVIVEEEDEESPNNKVVAGETPTNGVGGGGSSFGRKVLRSRSVGCGSRSFSGDFFERISNGFGDCALRRIESQREPNKVISNGGGGGEAADPMSEMVKCGGIFGGFMIMTSSTSSTTTSSSSTVDHHNNKMGNRSWGWAFASPMRAKTTTTHRGRTITESTTDKNTSPNLDSIPSLLALRS